MTTDNIKMFFVVVFFFFLFFKIGLHFIQNRIRCHVLISVKKYIYINFHLMISLKCVCDGTDNCIVCIQRRSHRFLRRKGLRWAASSDTEPSNMRELRGFRSSCACTKHHQGLCSPFIHSIAFSVLLADNKGPDKTARMRMLIWAVAFHICP